MDTIMQAQSALEPVFEQWLSRAPEALKDGASFEQWSEQGASLFGAADAIGLDTSRLAATITGTIEHGRAAIGSSTRRGARRPGANGSAPTDEQLLDMLREMGRTNQSRLAEHFGVSRQTIARKLDALVNAGKAVTDGQGARKTWRARELQPA